MCVFVAGAADDDDIPAVFFSAAAAAASLSCWPVVNIYSGIEATATLSSLWGGRHAITMASGENTERLVNFIVQTKENYNNSAQDLKMMCDVQGFRTVEA